MGFNTTVLILNDNLNEIENDPDFGKNLARAITQLSCRGPIDVPARSGHSSCAKAALVIETHHADYDVYVKIGGNYGEVISPDLIKKHK